MQDPRISRPPGRFRPRAGLADTRLWASPYLSEEERTALSEAVRTPRMVDAGFDLCREGESVDALLFLVDGWAIRHSTTGDGSRQIAALAVPGDLANLDSFLLERIDCGVRVIKRATVVALPRDKALALAAEHPGIARTFTWLALVENAVLAKWAVSLGRRSSKERLAHLFCELSVRLGGETGNESGFELPLTQEQLADALGLTPVHINRVMQQLRAEGLIATASRVMTIPDVAKLRRTAEFDPRYLHTDQEVSAPVR